MKHFSLLSFLGTFIVLLTVCISSVLAQDSLRILTYNVRNCRGLDDYSVINTARIGQVVLKQNPDVAGIQELDNLTQRSQSRNILEELAAETKMTPTYGPAIEFQGGLYGVGILSKEKPIRTTTVPLPGKEEKRVLLIAEFDRYVFFCTHFSLTEASRLESVLIINAERQKYADKPVVLVGDLNATPDSEVIQTLNKTWQRVSGLDYTFSADKPYLTIDYVYVSCPNGEKASIQSSQVVEESVASDHRPVLTVVEFPKTAER